MLIVFVQVIIGISGMTLAKKFKDLRNLPEQTGSLAYVTATHMRVMFIIFCVNASRYSYDAV